MEKQKNVELINQELLQKLVNDAIKKYVDKEYIENFISLIVRDAINRKRDSWSNKTILEEEMEKALLKEIKVALKEEINKKRELIRKQVKKLLEKRGLDVIIDRIIRVSVEKIAEAIKVEAWIEQ